MTVTAPTRGLTREAVAGIIRRACVRAGLAEVGRIGCATPPPADGGPRCAAGRDRAGAAAPQPGVHGELRPGGCGPADRTGPPLAGTTRRDAVMTALGEHVADYLALRRSLGFKLVHEGHIPPEFAAYLESAGSSRITADLAITWARLPAGVQPVTWTHRLGAVRGFARYLHVIDPATEIPPRAVFAGQGKRPTLYAYSTPTSTGGSPPPATCVRPCGQRSIETCLGCWPCPACGSGSVEPAANRPRPARRRGHRHRRQVRRHDTTAAAPSQHHRRATRLPAAARPIVPGRHRRHGLPLRTRGTALTYGPVRDTFNRLTTTIGLRTATVHPRIHDLRHSFAVHTLIGGTASARMSPHACQR